ncbi:MAG: transcriptional repressor [Hahellaceae bacterium]|nr:transcriptional repressor [Hahellaceae bacterium]MCP5169330.1 transcriptional repressor [Hahellaceae bacterium]
MPTASLLAYQPHDHDRCVVRAMQRAQSLCDAKGARLTPMRKRVLELIWQSHQALGAYDLIAALLQEGSKAAPPTVYRALEFLQETGLIHRIASLNAYIGCSVHKGPHMSCLMICKQCRNVQEKAHPELEQLLLQPAVLGKFLPEQSVVEITGLCPACQKAPIDCPTKD